MCAPILKDEVVNEPKTEGETREMFVELGRQWMMIEAANQEADILRIQQNQQMENQQVQIIEEGRNRRVQLIREANIRLIQQNQQMDNERRQRIEERELLRRRIEAEYSTMPLLLSVSDALFQMNIHLDAINDELNEVFYE